MRRPNVDWQRTYEAALLELDPTRVPELINRARWAISQRLANSDFSQVEQNAMQDALHNLDVLLRISSQEKD
jgi:hypothetical protein